MSKRLDEVFSVEKLRRSWRGVATEPSRAEPAHTDDAPNGGASAAEASYRRLLETIERRFSSDCVAATAPLMEELEQLLRQRFPADTLAMMPRTECARLTVAIDGLLNRMEDLLEAFEAGLGR
ncbi:MAG: hypothetical protein ABFD97_13050 [Syntrophobacter sp.]